MMKFTQSKFLTSIVAVGSALVASAQPVQWRVSDGGNGHWYERRAAPSQLTWDAAVSVAEAAGGHLATLTSLGEANFVTPLGAAGCWLGGRAPAGQGCNSAAWQWVTGEPWSYTNWSWAEPGDCSETYLAFAAWGGYDGRWNNQTGGTNQYLIEWSADCNGDGIVDLGQILAGQLSDADGNGRPDVCDGTTCLEVIGDSAQLSAPSPAPNARFGDGIAFDGSWAAVGSEGQASLFLYELTGNGWTWRQTLAVPDYQGVVALDGNMLVAGAWRADGGRGAAFVFERTAGNVWQQVARLQPADLGSQSWFGNSVAVDGTRIVIGSRLDAGWRGSVYVFDRLASGAWDQVAKLDPGVSVWREFGYSTAVVGDMIAVGDQYCGGCAGVEGGNVYIFTRQQSGEWRRTQTLSEADGGPGSGFGGQIATDGSVLCVGAPFAPVNGAPRSGRVFIYEMQPDGIWSKVHVATYPDGTTPYSIFGAGVACLGNTVLAAAESPDGQSRAFVITKVAGTWRCGGRLDAVSDSPGSGLGHGWSKCMSLRPTGAWLGAPYDRDVRGAAYFFPIGCSAPAVIDQPVSQTIIPGSTVSFSVGVANAVDSYRWRKNGSDLVEGGRFSGVAASVLAIANVQASDQGQYSCIVSNACGSVTSTQASLSCKATVAQQPIGGTYLGGQTLVLAAEVSTGGTTSYRWKRDGVNVFNGPIYSGVVTPTLTINANDPSQSGSYTLSITNPCGITTTVPAVVEVRCPADFNSDGGIDGEDVSEFFSAWESGDSAADVSFDGGVDGSDVSVFFERWENGC